jgi:hypothetical protein
LILEDFFRKSIEKLKFNSNLAKIMGPFMKTDVGCISDNKKVKQSRYRPGVAQRVAG